MMRKSEVLILSRHMDFVGQRADKAVVVDVAAVKDVSHGYGGIVKNGVIKEVERYTVTCDDCGGDGYYDQRGEIICEGCGMVLSGGRPAVLRTEYSEGDDKSIGKGRGVEKVDDVPGTAEPAQAKYD